MFLLVLLVILVELVIHINSSSISVGCLKFPYTNCASDNYIQQLYKLRNIVASNTKKLLSCESCLKSLVKYFIINLSIEADRKPFLNS